MMKSIWPEWELLEKIGQGSYGVVYSAVRKEFDMENKAAIKVITIPSNSSEIDSLRSEGLDMNATRNYLKQIVTEFVKEIELMMALLGKTNIVSIQDYKVEEKKDELGWEIHIRMELLTPLDQYVRLHDLTEDDILKIGCDICTALDFCEKKGIIHRDIKPANIFVDDLGNFKLGDFGIARKLDRLGDNLTYNKYSPNYVAPEVVRAAHYDARVDQYSLGIVLYQLVNNNHLPFLENEPPIPNPELRKEALWRRLNGEDLPAPCKASTRTASVILCACAHDPDDRYASATELKKALEQRLKTRTILLDCVSAGGSINPSGKVTVEKGRNFTFNVRADEGYIISQVIIRVEEKTICCNRFDEGAELDPTTTCRALNGGAKHLVMDPTTVCRRIPGSNKSQMQHTIQDVKDDYIIDAVFEEKEGGSGPGGVKKVLEKLKKLMHALSNGIYIKIMLGILLAGLIGSVCWIGFNWQKDEDNPEPEENTSVASVYSKSEEERIAFIIKDAEAFASEEDYEAALEKIEEGLATYPKSYELQKKADEYREEIY